SHIVRDLDCFRFFLLLSASTPYFYTLSLHDALPISARVMRQDTTQSRDAKAQAARGVACRLKRGVVASYSPDFGHAHRRPCPLLDRKSTRLNSSHGSISYAVFCLKKKNKSISCYHYV